MKILRNKKAMSLFMGLIFALSFVFSAGLNTNKVYGAQTGGWHYSETKYYQSTLDYELVGEIRNGVIGTSDVIYDKYTIEGSEGNSILLHSRRYDDGTPIAHVKYQVTWDTPPKYLAPEQKTGFNVEVKKISASSWSIPPIGAKYDMANMGSITGATEGGISFITQDGKTSLSEGKHFFESSKVIPKGSEGAKKAINLSLGNGFGYSYIYEWKNESATTAPVSSINMIGEWSLSTGRGFKGKVTVSEQSGTSFTGKINIDGSAVESLSNGVISGNTITFTRLWANGTNQKYTGTYSVKNGTATVAGNFSGAGGSDTWSMTKGESTTTTPTTPSSKNAAEPFDSGARIMWQPASNVLGYRLFRSTNKSQIGISVTDFYITSTSYADVNVQPNTTYYYTVKPVLAEAKPFEGIDEKLGNTISTFTVTTGGGIYKAGVFKHFILLKLDSPYMSVDGIEQEVDPGKNTAPIIISGRSMVPIRAIVEAMGGTIGWDGGTKKVNIDARGNNIDMWIDKIDIKANNKNLQMDVSPAIKGGRTFLPIRFVGENLNCKVDWINSTKEIVIVYEEKN